MLADSLIGSTNRKESDNPEFQVNLTPNNRTVLEKQIKPPFSDESNEQQDQNNLIHLSKHYRRILIFQSESNQYRYLEKRRQRDTISVSSSFEADSNNNPHSEIELGPDSSLVLESLESSFRSSIQSTTSATSNQLNLSKNSSKQAQQLRKAKMITELIESDDLKGLKGFNLSVKDIQDLRFEFNRNILQIICYFGATQIMNWLTEKLANKNDVKFSMAKHRDSLLGSQAQHLAAITGNFEIIQALLQSYNVNVRDCTLGKQSLHHCATQGYHGISTIFLLSRTYNLSINLKDLKGATPLHFAVISMQIKNVQALIKLGANPNSQDIEGNTPLHLIIQAFVDLRSSFEKLKNIGKELLFSGASRSITNNAGQTPSDLLQINGVLLEEADFKKMKYVLTQPEGMGLLRMTRPIEKVERNPALQRAVLIFDLINIAFFFACGIWQQNLIEKNPTAYHWLETTFIITAIFFILTVIFYILTVFLDPGYVPTDQNFIELLQKLKKQKFHLDYICVYCENLRPENADHCNFCNRCVQKFDHHCVFVNNCLGYRNHKWFILLLLSFTLFMIALLIHSTFAFIAISVQYNFSEHKVASFFKILIALYMIFVVLIHSPVVFLQLQSQYGKLIKIQESGEGEADVKATRDGSETGTAYDQGTEYDQTTLLQEDIEDNFNNKKPATQWEALQKNLKVLFTFRPQSQEYLYNQLFANEQNNSENSNDDDESNFGGESQFIGEKSQEEEVDLKTKRQRSKSLTRNDLNLSARSQTEEKQANSSSLNDSGRY